ncbi:hypothetical protein HFO56_00495 [Rhizobium laguerreae]|uniref:hypothetical protein n=1 Tax=Rhizobium laguerreae TaxID=1076926 RepID=UPI001C908EA7|nr:hypothetical protein [Rhizobium laguerreae]MBY3150907.1 hypothetical protein [Rhizobium laguerreae]
MLFVDVGESLKSWEKQPMGEFYSSVMSGVVSRIGKASVFVLDQNATAMCANVFFSRPSSILSSLAFVRLPTETVWIEYSNVAAREAFARLGNDNSWREGGVFIERTGMLLTQREGAIEMEAVAQFRKDDGRIIELLTARCTFDTTPGIKIDPAERRTPKRFEHNSTGQAKRYYDLLSRDEKELAARDEITHRFGGSLHPDYVSLVSSLGGEDFKRTFQKTLEGHVSDTHTMFTTQILPALILMNCRNAIEQEYVEAPAKLNKARRAKGRPEIGPYRIVKLKLRPKQKRLYEQRGYTGIQMSGGLVIGHFKVRKTGVFWWSPFVRGIYSHEAPRTVHMVTP